MVKINDGDGVMENLTTDKHRGAWADKYKYGERN